MSMPQLEKTAESLGIITFLIPSSLARNPAARLPPPPKATLVNSLGSYPLFTLTKA